MWKPAGARAGKGKSRENAEKPKEPSPASRAGPPDAAQGHGPKGTLPVKRKGGLSKMSAQAAL